MMLSLGSRLGPFEIVSALGAGGMGEVYRARDTRLGREVAIKVLPAHLSSSAEQRQRLEREAKTISQLSHPHICALFDVGHQDGTDYLVMELLEGTTLADRLGRGAIPVEQALKIGIEIASALDAAHRSGIVHRDLKPGNIMLTKAGVKLLDFGLAKLAAPQAAVSHTTSLPTALQESTPLTARGTILGTFQYMSPEQLEGREADARSDLFALGCVLYEMLTGRKAFSGKSQASLIGAIMNSEPPPISSLQPMTPPALDRIVKGCLAKEPEDRWNTAHDVMLQLQGVAEGGSQAGAAASLGARRRGGERLAWWIAAAALAAAVLAGVGYVRKTPPASPSVRAFLLPPPKVDFSFTDADCGSLAVSPDGRLVLLAARVGEGRSSLWVQPLDEATAKPIPGTEGATFPFWSPDSRFVAFFADGKLQKVDLAGAPPVPLCDAPNGRSGSWSRDGVILFSPDAFTEIFQVSSGGGKATPVTALDLAHSETTHRWVTFLPDGRHFLFLGGSHSTGAKSESNAIYVGEIGSRRRTLLVTVRSNVAYASGRLLYMREHILLAQAFDAGSQKLEGDPVPLAENVQYDAAYFRGAFSVSDNGVLVYITGPSAPKPRLVWLDRNGKQVGEPVGEGADYLSQSLAPDGVRIAAAIGDPVSGNSDVWLLDAHGVRTRFTFGAPALSPVWSPDGSRIAYTKLEPGGNAALCTKRADGGGQEQVLFRTNRFPAPQSWSPDGRLLAFDLASPSGAKTQNDIWIAPSNGGEKPYAFLATSASESSLQFSPDGKWACYVSDESGRNELYVVPFPGPGGKRQVSSDGSIGGFFVRGGKEIIFGDLDGNALSVQVRSGAADFEMDPPKVLFRVPSIAGPPSLSLDGEKILVVLEPAMDASSRVALMTNWPARLPQK